MGAGQSTASQAPPRALHVLRVTPASPASQTNIEPFFDFVVGFKGDSFSSNNNIDASELEKIVESHEGRTLNLLVWNSKSQDARVVPIVPSRDWSSPHSNTPDPQEPEADRKPSLLGLSMRMCEPEFALDNVWHVLDVLEGSPAESAGLVPYGDWIIGWSGGVLSSEGDFYDVVEAHIEKPLRVYVYSYDFDTIREVVLVPNRQWGGEGLLGCVFGFGLIHRIPPLPADREPGAVPPELTQDADELEEQQLFVPADLPGETPEQIEERMRWEHEEWEREQSYGRNYVHNHDPAYQTSSTYFTEARHAHGDHPSSIHRPEEAGDEHDHAHGHGHNHSHNDDHEPGHDHDHEHEREHRHEHITTSPPPPGRAVPVRSASLTSPRAATPTQARPLGGYMNGLGMGSRTPAWETRGIGSGVGNASTSTLDAGDRGAAVLRGGDRGEAGQEAGDGNGTADDADRDGTVSVAGTDATETTDMSSEASQGSLTSVD